MSRKLPGLPAPPSVEDVGLHSFLEAVREYLAAIGEEGNREILIGPRQGRPGPGVPERFYYATDVKCWFYDTGKEWVPVLGAGQRLFLVSGTATVLPAVIPWNTRLVDDPQVYKLRSSNTEIEVQVNGLFRIQAEITTYISDSSTTRSTSRARLQRNGTDLAGASTYMYNREYNNDTTSGSITYITNLSKNDRIGLYGNKVNGSAQISAIADGTRLLIERIG